jgi:6-phosphogluconolactonase
MSLEGVEKGVKNPSFLAADTRKMILYAVNEVGEFKGVKGGGVSAFRIDRETGMLSFINSQSSGGESPCHLAVNNNGTFAVAGNYSGGSLSLLPLMPDGNLGSLKELIQHTGSGADPKRQEKAHVHCILLDKENKHILVSDLGIDRIIVYPVDKEKLEINRPEAKQVLLKPGAGPRHLAFSPDEKFLYVINELNSTITSFKYESSDGSMTEVQTLSSLPPDFSEINYCADIHVHPSGKFLYGSNRGHNSIAVYGRNQETGVLNLIELVPTGGETPRNFAIAPDGNFLLVANQSTNNIVTFRIDRETGRLKPTGDSIEIPTPVCIRFL